MSNKHKKDKSSSKKVLAPKISANEMEKGKILGQGMFGVVYLGKCRGHEVAIKELKNFNAELKEDFIAEVEIMAQVCESTSLLSHKLLMGVGVESTHCLTLGCLY